MKYSISITQSHRPANGEICNKSYLAHRPWSAVTEPAGCASPKEQTINQDQFTLSLQTACLIQQNQMLKRQNAMLLELLERRYDATSTVFCTQYAKKDWHQRLGSGVHADAIMDRIVHNTIWIETGSTNMREQTALTG